MQLRTILTISMLVTPNVFAYQLSGARDPQAATQQAEYQEKLQHVINDKADYAAGIVSRWENSEAANGKWDANAAADLYIALMKLKPESLLAAGEASTYEGMMAVIATGSRAKAAISQPGPLSPNTQVSSNTQVSPNALGDSADDMVYTPVAPCRIVDTRVIGGIVVNGSQRNWDMDGSNFSSQGGSSTDCGIPFGVAQAVAMNITVTQPSGPGYVTAWRYVSARPLASVLNFVTGQTVANSTIIPTNPGGGADFSVYVAGGNAHMVIDVIGYFAAPVATALDCTTANSALTSVPVNLYTPVDAICPAGTTATGGGWFSNEGTGGYQGVWVLSQPGAAYNFNGWRVWVDNQTNGNRNIQAWAVCCRIPGR